MVTRSAFATMGTGLPFVITTFLLVWPVSAQNQPGTEGLIDETEFSGALQSPIRPQVGIAPLASRLSFNSTQIEFGKKRILNSEFEFGDNRNLIPGGEFNYIFNTDINQHLAIGKGGNRLETAQRAWVFQLRAIDRQRTVTRSIERNGAILGLQLDYSITGQCILPGSQADDYCTYTPGVATIPGAVDSDTLAPTGFLITTDFGDTISQELHDSLQTENFFQRGEDVDPDGLVGLSMNVPNAGFFSAIDAPNLFEDGAVATIRGTRTETVQRRVVPSLGRIDQTLMSNSREAAATRTTRALIIPDRDEVDTRFVLMQLAAWLLPSAPSSVPYRVGTPVTSVSNNLFFSLNNARVPASSFTMFQTGRAKVSHPRTPPQSAAQTPEAQYLGFWMGMSPVRDTRVSVREQFTPTGDRLSITDPVFRQGGFGTPFQELLDTGVTVFDQFDQSITNLEFQNIDDLFIQVGLDVSTQDALRRVSTMDTTRYRLVPHLSVNGNRTGGESMLRYYAGAILGDKTNAYIGLDYSFQTETGWNAYGRLDLYANPNQDHFSEAELRASRTFTINPTRQVTLGAGAVVGLDNSARLFGNGGLTVGGANTRADIVGRWREGSMDFTTRQRFSRDEGQDWARSTTLGFAYAAGNQLSISSQITPISTEKSFIEGAIGLNYRFSDRPDAPLFRAQYVRARYDIGAGVNGDRLRSTDNIFQAGFQAQF
jgi:opacity protein-like surface antigen